MNDAPAHIKPLFDLSALDLTELAQSFSPEKQSVIADSEKFVVFFLGEEFFAVSAGQVIEIVQPPGSTPLPRAPDWLHGIANLRGEIISILNVAKLCGKKTMPVSTKTKLIVLKPQIFDSPVAFLVDKISEIIILPK